jgi:hypothetical protein
MRWTRVRHLDEGRGCGRQNRVVLISRRWDQALRDGDVGPGGPDTPRKATVAIKPGHRGERV